MKYRLFSIVFLFACSSLFFSCAKQSDPTIPRVVQPPNDTTLHTAGPLQIVLDVPNAASVYNTWGKLIAMESDSSYLDYKEDTVHTGGQYGFAFFTDSATNINLSAGNVSLNNTAINTLLVTNYKGTVSGLDNGCNWLVTGSDYVPAISYNYGGPFPRFIGSFPYKVTKAEGISLSFNPNTIANADSVYVVVMSTDASNKTYYYTQSFSANAGNVVITGSDINYLPANTTNTGGAYITVIPFEYVAGAYGDKKFIFVKQAEISHQITLQ